MQSLIQETEEQGRYVQFSCAGMTLFWNALGAGTVRERDMFTIMALVNNAHPWTGHVWPTAQTCFEEAKSGMSRTAIAASLKRLREAGLVKRFMDKRLNQASYAINPRLVGIGPADARRRLWEKWQADKI